MKFHLVTRQFLFIVSILPLIDFTVSLVFSWLDIHPMFRLEADGIARLQCSTIPANFAMTVFFAIYAHACNYRELKIKRNLYFSYLLILFFLLYLTGARMALFCALLVAIFVILKNFKINKFKASIIGLCLLVVSGYFLVANNSRNFSDSEESTLINTSGRSAAWVFFFNEFRKNEKFGIGHGNSRNYFLGSEIEFFTTPHNEYIRLLLEGGLLLSVLMLLLAIKFLLGRWKSFQSDLNIADYSVGILYGVTLIFSITDNTFSTYQFTLPFFFMIKYFDQIKSEVSKSKQLNE
jgi:O-antigen ligase